MGLEIQRSLGWADFSALARWIAAVGALALIAPPRSVAETAVEPAEFSHLLFDDVLQQFVDASGRVDYAALKRQRRDLERYTALLAAISPRNRSDLFPDRQARLAYWINAYNASVVQRVLDHYPIESVTEVRPPAIFFFLPRLSGFFLFERVTLGGDRMSLHALENMIRKRFEDPRIHFALNCASASCPTLPRRAFAAATLDSALEAEALKFVSQQRNVRVDPEARTIELSSIFDWYEDDFVNWQARLEGPQRATLLDYIESLLPPEKISDLRDCAECTVLFIPYDWRLNDQARLPKRTTGEPPASSD